MKEIEIKPFPNEVMEAFENTTDEIIKEIEAKDPRGLEAFFKNISVIFRV